ncbi:endonuclease domain-containing protein [Streptomyces sp. NRRL F-2664]|uniref:endonuclease domain-containing protein n=1 Tax=Streptomyces sp. NRRL F-2664 TaxID=1463842 RepID=UPI0004CB70CF|nr:endonuclease domain-containing protein [Streptomyces sp. NRRL F-2664]
MSERVLSGGHIDGLAPLAAADSMWAGLTAASTVPAASAVFTRPSAGVRAGKYVVLGTCVVELVSTNNGQWRVPTAQLRQAAAAWNTVELDAFDLVRIGPFHPVPQQDRSAGTLRRWRQSISRELQSRNQADRQGSYKSEPPSHRAGVDWRRMLVERRRDGAERSWWLPRAVVRLLDAAEHAETRWLQAHLSTPATEESPRPMQPRATADGTPPATGEADPTVQLRPYAGELQGQLYSVLTRRPGMSRTVAGWVCAVCGTAPAAVLDHCHEHGYVRAPVCLSCNTLERPDHLYNNDIRVAGRYSRLFGTDTVDWLHHWHRCPGCRARTTLPLPHLAAWTAHTACRTLRPTHRQGRTRKPCGVLRVSWTGSQNTPRSCLLTVSVDFCPSGEHRILTRVPYREALGKFGTWLADTAPVIAADAGPERLDGLPPESRLVVADTSGEALALF